MILVRFTSADGGRVTEVQAHHGARLLDIAQTAGQPLEGTCGGQLACATCHLILSPESFAALPRPSAEEEDMLDFAPGARATSRLACQITLPATLDRLEAHIPPA